MLQVFNGMAFKPYPKNKGTIVCVAGGEAKEFMDIFLDMNVRSVLLSFFYIRRKFKRDKDLMNRLKDEFSNFDYVFVDSGGFTLQQEKRRGKLKVSLRDYIQEYKDFALEMQEHVTVFGAIDSIEDNYTFGDYAEHLYDFKNEGIHVAPTVWVNTDWGLINKYKFTKEFDIVGLSGARFDRRSAIKQFYRLKKEGVKVHGYAATSQDHFQFFHRFYSVDSISWLMSQRYGLTFNFKAGKIRMVSPYRKVEERRHIYALNPQYDIDPDAIMKENVLRNTKQSVPQEVYDEINKLNLIAWLKLADHEVNKSIGSYWNSPNNKFKYEYIED